MTTVPAQHRSLVRQLRRLGLTPDTTPADPGTWQDLLGEVSRAYREADEERYTLERSLDISSNEMRQLHDTLSHRARHDTLTGLPNRAALTEVLAQVLDACRAGGHEVAVLFVDLDGFKLVNDSLGHQVGDELLVRAAERICSSVRPDDVVARLGGDEFVVLCPGVQGPDVAVGIARRVGDLLQKPFQLTTAAQAGEDGTPSTSGTSRGAGRASVSCSIGIAMTGGAVSADQLIANADMAMYEAKAQGRARFILFDDAMRSRAEDRLDIEGALWHAVDRGELQVHFQPVVDLHTGRMTSAEALVRWMRPGHGLLMPSGFVPIAEQSRLITVIDAWVLEEACRQASSWPDTGIGIGVNLSTRDVRSDLFLPMLHGVLERTGFDPARLTLELTETALMNDSDAATEALAAAGRLGVRTSIDDFGTGYWSMSHLRRLPVHTLKIDQSIVVDVATDRTAEAITRAITAMGHALGLKIVAEGIENPEQAARLADLQCDSGQGYWFARPQPGQPRLARPAPSGG